MRTHYRGVPLPEWWGRVRQIPLISDIPDVQADERGEFQTRWGRLLYVMIASRRGRRLTWSEVHTAFAAIYPGRWAMQAFPPNDLLVDRVNAYHLWVLPFGERPPFGLDDETRTGGVVTAPLDTEPAQPVAAALFVEGAEE